MNSALYSYLLQQRSLSIPGLGTIFIERVPAQSDIVNRQLLAPSYHYRFDKYFDAPDKDFFAYLASAQQTADYEAIRWYNEWAYELRNRIRADHPVQLERIGLLKKDLNGEIQFEAEKAIADFLEPVPARRVIRVDAPVLVRVGDREILNQQQEAAAELPLREKESWWIYAALAAAIALLILFFQFYNHGFSLEAAGNQQKIRVNP